MVCSLGCSDRNLGVGACDYVVDFLGEDLGGSALGDIVDWGGGHLFLLGLFWM